MYSLRDLSARQVISLSSALILTVAVSGAAFAQDESPLPGEETAANEATEPAASMPAEPGKFKAASVPRGVKGQRIGGVIAGGPGYIAVGGGSRTGLDMKAIIWVSDSGRHWQPVPLFGDAAMGLIEDVAATPAGYIAVGRDFVPEGRDGLTHALVWHSDEGLIWERVPAQASFEGSIMYDVAATPEGAIAVGCKAGLHCEAGRTWTTTDGMTWELSAEVPLAAWAVAASGPTVVTGGMDDAIDYGNGRAVLASSSDAITWGVTEPLAESQSGIYDIAIRDGGFLAAGSQWPPDAAMPLGVLRVSPDGQTWDVITVGKLEGLAASAVGSSDDLTIVAGMRDRGSTPSVIWSDDLVTFKSAKLAPAPSGNGVELSGATVDAEGGLAFVVGADGFRPTIWVSSLK